MSKIFGFGGLPEKVGRYGVELTPKTRMFLEKRAVSLLISCRLGWVEDGARNVIECLLSENGIASDFLRLRYPENCEAGRRRTDIGEARHTLLYRFRYLFRCLILVADRYYELDDEDIASLRSTLWALADIFRGILGEGAYRRMGDFINRMSGLFNAVNHRITDSSSFAHEVELLLEEVDALFECLHDQMAAKEAELSRQKDELAAVAEEMAKANRINDRAVKACERALVRGREEEEDPYSRMAGLERLNAAQRKELVTVFRYSHERYPVLRGAREGERSLKGLAHAVWLANAEEFEALAKLNKAPGYKSESSLATKLYKLARRHPLADHFRWE